MRIFDVYLEGRDRRHSRLDIPGHAGEGFSHRVGLFIFAHSTRAGLTMFEALVQRMRVSRQSHEATAPQARTLLSHWHFVSFDRYNLGC